MEELEDYVEKTEDVQLGMMIEIVREYGNRILEIIKTIKEKHINNDDKENAEMIFSTVHRCKGMEYDAIQLVNDFISEQKIEKLLENKENSIVPEKINEEINLLYVAITRAKESIHIPETLMPRDFPTSSQIHITKVLSDENKKKLVIPAQAIPTMKKTEEREIEKNKVYTYEEIREKHKDAYKPWTFELDEELTIMYCEGENIRDMAIHFGRTKDAIRSRIKKLELKDLYG